MGEARKIKEKGLIRDSYVSSEVAVKEIKPSVPRGLLRVGERITQRGIT
ncbi:hypothetical protein LCGC14_1464390, partial [marine sediment metagenome]